MQVDDARWLAPIPLPAGGPILRGGARGLLVSGPRALPVSGVRGLVISGPRTLLVSGVRGLVIPGRRELLPHVPVAGCLPVEDGHVVDVDGVLLDAHPPTRIT